MYFSRYVSQCICFLSLLGFAFVSSVDVKITIPLNKTLTLLDKELYGNFHSVASNSTVQIYLTNINKKINFIIFQVHTHIYNVTLYNNTLLQHSSITGTNLGLYGTLKPPDTYYVVNKNGFDLNMYISVHGYGIADPIPGGCNMEFPISISPFMRVRYTKDIITVDAPAAKDPKDFNCLGVGLKAEIVFYRMYLSEQDFNEDSYFNGIRSLITLEKIRENGDVINITAPYWNQRRLLSAYPGTGSVYVAVAYSPNSYSVYVPTHTYACPTFDGCNYLDDFMSELLCACLFFLGLFTCFLGHRFFKTEMFIVGMFAGVIITYILISMWTDLDRPSLLTASVVSGIFFGSIWVVFWWYYGIPVVAVALATMHLGFLLSSLLYHTASDTNIIFRVDGAFWTIFIALMICTSITLTTVSYISNLLCCAILGAFAVVFAIDQYMGSNLKYIVINTMRRAVVENFVYVTLQPPFQLRDTIATVIWVTLAVTGFLFQYYHNRNRPPFPPPPRSVCRPLGPAFTYGTVDHSRIRFRNASNLIRPPSVAMDPARTNSERTPLLANAQD